MQVNGAIMNAQMQALLKQRLTLGNMASPFGSANFFDRCADGIMSLHFAAQLPLLDWMGFQVDDEYRKTLEFLTYVRPAYSGGNPTAGYLSDPCSDPNGVEIGSTTLELTDFGRYGRVGPTRDMMKPTKYCATDPRWRLDGTAVSDEREWDMRFVTDVILQDIARHVVTGNKTTAGQFDGLERIVKTGYSSAILDSIVIDMNNNPLAGGSGVTWNGNAIASTYDFVDILRAVVRRIRTRVQWSPVLANQTMNLGDMILVMPSSAISDLLDFFTCWSVCGSTDDLTVMLQTPEARAYRANLEGGLFGHGQIIIEGIPIPILGYDYGLLKGPTTGDIYLLTGRVGSVRMWEGQHLSAASAASAFGGQGYFSTDGGRMLGVYETDNECQQLKMWMHPRIWCRAPWAQVRFQDVKLTPLGGFLSPDPLETSWYPVTSFGADLATTS